MLKTKVIAVIIIASIGAANAQILPDSVAAKDCWNCEAWNKTHPPFQVFGNSYYVGTAGLSAVLITTPHGHILLDGALPQSASLIDQSIRSLGFDTKDIKYIANSHAHYDHAGGIAALQKETGAYVISSEAGTKALAAGEPQGDDPLFAYGKSNSFPPIENLQVVKDRGEIRLGDIVLTAHHTPGHTSGGVTWTWKSCANGHCFDGRAPYQAKDRMEELFKKIESVPDFAGHVIDGVNHRNGYGDSPLHIVSNWGDIDAIKLPVSGGADINAQGETGFTPLYCAVEQNHPIALKTLLSLGVKAIKDSSGDLPIDLAKSLQHNECINVLQQSI